MLLLLLFSTLITITTAQSCMTIDCTSACSEYDAAISNCHWDPQPSDNGVTCLCTRGAGLEGNVATLNQCVVCNQDGLGTHPLSTYQVDQFICAVYYEQGESAALSVNSASPASEVVAAFSMTNLPAIQSVFCSAGGDDSGGAVSSSSLSPAPIPSTSTMGAEGRAIASSSVAVGSSPSKSTGGAAATAPPAGLLRAMGYGMAIVVAGI